MSKEPKALADYFEDYKGDIYAMHPPEACSPQSGEAEFSCVIHRPTEHRTRHWPLTLDTRPEVFKTWLDHHGLPQFVPLMLRVCPCADAEHLIPDFDAVMHWERTIGSRFPSYLVPLECGALVHSEPTEAEVMAYNKHVEWMDAHWSGWDIRDAMSVGRRRPAPR